MYSLQGHSHSNLDLVCKLESETSFCFGKVTKSKLKQKMLALNLVNEIVILLHHWASSCQSV